MWRRGPCSPAGRPQNPTRRRSWQLEGLGERSARERLPGGGASEAVTISARLEAAWRWPPRRAEPHEPGGSPDDGPLLRPTGRDGGGIDALHGGAPGDERALPGGDRARPRRQRRIAQGAADLPPAA